MLATMTMPPTPASRPDVDIVADIDALVRSFIPLRPSKSFFSYTCHNGAVTLAGNVRNAQAVQVLTTNVPRIVGVTRVNAANLYDDETVRVAIGQLLPPGVYVSVQHGGVALTGKLPAGASAEVITNAVGAVPGVRRVGAEFEAY
jgi:hypothetical protein